MNEQYKLRYDQLREEINELSVSIRLLEERREKLRSERDRYKRYIFEPNYGSHGGSDSLVVSRKMLGDVLAEYFVRTGDSRRNLAARSKVPTRTIRAIMNLDGSDKRATKWVGLRIADKLLTATDQEDELRPGGRLTIVANPQFDRTKNGSKNYEE